jgi:hypothetical protein
MKTYEQFVSELFTDHELDLGIMCEEEIADTLADYPTYQIERWLVRCGYEPKTLYSSNFPESGEF